MKLSAGHPGCVQGRGGRGLDTFHGHMGPNPPEEARSAAVEMWTRTSDGPEGTVAGRAGGRPWTMCALVCVHDACGAHVHPGDRQQQAARSRGGRACRWLRGQGRQAAGVPRGPLPGLRAPGRACHVAWDAPKFRTLGARLSLSEQAKPQAAQSSSPLPNSPFERSRGLESLTVPGPSA